MEGVIGEILEEVPGGIPEESLEELHREAQHGLLKHITEETHEVLQEENPEGKRNSWENYWTKAFLKKFLKILLQKFKIKFLGKHRRII